MWNGSIWIGGSPPALMIAARRSSKLRLPSLDYPSPCIETLCIDCSRIFSCFGLINIVFQYCRLIILPCPEIEISSNMIFISSVLTKMLFPEDLLWNTYYILVSDLSWNEMVAIRRDKGDGGGVPLTTLTMHTNGHTLTQTNTDEHGRTNLHSRTHTTTPATIHYNVMHWNTWCTDVIHLSTQTHTKTA